MNVFGILLSVCLISGTGAIALADGNCGPNPDASAGNRNFDGSCTFDYPQILVDGSMLPLSASGDMEATGTGFCKFQGFSSGVVVENGCTETTCNGNAAILTSDGTLQDIYINSDSGFSEIMVLICR